MCVRLQLYMGVKVKGLNTLQWCLSSPPPRPIPPPIQTTKKKKKEKQNNGSLLLKLACAALDIKC